MPYTVVVANQKGGVGKTTTVAHLGVAFAQRGIPTLMVDLDPQAALTSLFGLDPYTVRPAVGEVLRQGPQPQAVRRVDEGLYLLPARTDLLGVAFHLLKAPARLVRLQRALPALLPPEVRLVLFDTPPHLGVLTLNALVAARWLLVPVTAEYLAMRGVRPLLETVQQVRKQLALPLRLLALVPTRVDPRSPYAATAVREMHRAFPGRVTHTVIPVDESLAVAPAARQTALTYRPHAPAAQAYRALAGELWKEVAHGA